MRKTINTSKAPAAVGPYCHAVRVDNLIFTSGQIGLNPETNELVDGVEAQAQQAIDNIAAVLSEEGLTLDDVVKTTVFLDDVNDFGAINEIYAKAFKDNKPARSCVEAGALPKGALFEMEVIAAAK
ncbi:MAG: RidA family protein [Anaerostipes sp.]|jgi:2-iminobutanoate/2-iminopropanoate deaminase|nr:RidA family protein [Anaerostipes sp.]MDD3745969.1 RidA family protein [Anaerostipes sp.]